MTLARNVARLLATSSLTLGGAAWAAQPATDSASTTTPPQVQVASADQPATTAPTQPTAAASTAPTPTEEEGLGIITVTANRRLQNMQDVPVSISTVQADTATQLGVSNAQEVVQLIPSVTFQRMASGSIPFIRGVGSTSSFVGNEPSVALYVDDVYIPTGNAAIFEFNNIQQVEVLKGPQGTLFGRNATGGVIHIRTREPTYHPTLDATLGYDSYDTLTAQVYGSTGITDNVAINLSGFYSNQHDGWGTNVVTHHDVYTSKSWGIRSRLLFEPDSRTSILLNGTYNHRRSDQGMALRVVPGFFGFGGYSPAALGAGFWDASAQDSFYDTDYWQLSGRIRHDFGNASFVGITALSNVDTHFELDLDASPTNLLYAPTDNTARTFTQEFQLLSSSSSPVQWILGGYYLHDNSYFALVGVNGVALGTNRQFEQDRQVTNSFSGYAQATFNILPRTNLTLGLRYTSDHRAQSDGGAAIINAAGGTVVRSGPFASAETFKNVTGRAAIEHHINDDVMIYAAYNRGFKSGVFNLPGYSTSTTAALPAVQPEQLDAYTVGFKSEFMDHRIRLNVEGFYYDFANIQVQNNVPPPNVGTILSNAGAATIKGVDVDFAFAVTNRLTINANVSIAHGTYGRFDNGPTFFPLPPNAQIPIPPGCAFTTYPTAAAGTPMAQRSCSLAGNDVVNLPGIASSVGFIYRVPVGFGELGFAGVWNHGGDYFSEPDNISFAHQPSYDLINASLTWTAPGEHVSIRGYVTNLLQERYYAYVANSGSSGTKYSPAAPRTYGVTLGVHF